MCFPGHFLARWAGVIASRSAAAFSKAAALAIALAFAFATLGSSRDVEMFSIRQTEEPKLFRQIKVSAEVYECVAGTT